MNVCITDIGWVGVALISSTDEHCPHPGDFPKSGRFVLFAWKHLKETELSLHLRNLTYRYPK